MYFYEVMPATAGTCCHLHTAAAMQDAILVFQRVHNNSELCTLYICRTVFSVVMKGQLFHSVMVSLCMCRIGTAVMMDRLMYI